MNTRHLEEFLVFAEELNYSSAAKRLFVTRPTLVEHLNELEKELGCKLTTKTQGVISLTHLGNRFRKTASDLVSLHNETIREYENLEKNLLVIRIAASNLPWLETTLYKVRKSIHARDPLKHIEIVTTNGPFSTADALLENENDIVIAGFKSYLEEESRKLPDGVKSLPFQTEEIKFLMTLDNPLFEKESFTVQDFDGKEIMLPPDLYEAYRRDGFADRLKSYGVHVTLQTADFTDHSEYFSHDFGAAFGIVPTTLLPRFGISERSECRAFTLTDLQITSDFYIMYRADFIDSENGKLFIDELTHIVQSGVSKNI